MAVTGSSQVQGTLVGFTAEELTTIRDAAKAAILAATVRGVSYTIANRTFTFPSLESAAALAAEANYALGLLTGQRSNFVQANFNPAIGRQAQV